MFVETEMSTHPFFKPRRGDMSLLTETHPCPLPGGDLGGMPISTNMALLTELIIFKQKR